MTKREALQTWNCELKKHGLPAQDSLDKTMERCSKVVSKWPAWKQNAFGSIRTKNNFADADKVDGTVSKPVHDVADARLASEKWYEKMQQNHWVVTPDCPKVVETNQQSIEALHEIKELYVRIKKLSKTKDQAVKDADYVLAAQLRDEREKLIERKRDLTGENPPKAYAPPINEKDCLPAEILAPEVDRLRGEVQALEAWQNVAAQSNRAISEYLQTEFPSLDLYGGMPIDSIRKVVAHLQGQISRPTSTSKMWFSTSEGPGVAQLAQQALSKLSGDLSHDNVAAAKQLLKKIID